MQSRLSLCLSAGWRWEVGGRDACTTNWATWFVNGVPPSGPVSPSPGEGVGGVSYGRYLADDVLFALGLSARFQIPDTEVPWSGTKVDNKRIWSKDDTKEKESQPSPQASSKLSGYLTMGVTGSDTITCGSDGTFVASIPPSGAAIVQSAKDGASGRFTV